MASEDLLKEVQAFCRHADLAESTFGRLAVNDGKLVSRLRAGSRITPPTLARVRAFMAQHPAAANDGSRSPAPPSPRQWGSIGMAGAEPQRQENEAETAFRFFDNRQKYLLFVNTCDEKQVVARRVAQELDNIDPRPPAVRLFDAGIGDGTVLTRVMRSMHARFPTMPFYVVGKEISLEDVRLALAKMPDRFFEHPETVLILTNMYYSEAPWLTARDPAAAHTTVWHELALRGASSHAFEEQITELQPFLDTHWTAHSSPKTGNPVYDRPVVLVLYREDRRFVLDATLPRRSNLTADYDLVIASQPYRARASTAFKAKRVVAPLARAVGSGGRLIGIHSWGHDPGLEIIQAVWPGENPFVTDRHALLKEVKQELGSAGRDLTFKANSDARSVFRYHMHAMPGEVSGAIGTSTLFAAWNAAVYVAQVEDQRLSEAQKGDAYIAATDAVLKKYGGLWFNDESYVISRRRS
jgi:hypothetical protein